MTAAPPRPGTVSLPAPGEGEHHIGQGLHALGKQSAPAYRAFLYLACEWDRACIAGLNDKVPPVPVETGAYALNPCCPACGRDLVDCLSEKMFARSKCKAKMEVGADG